jgi:peptidase E
VPADQPTILATSGGVVPSARGGWDVGPLTDYAIELSGVTGRAPKVCFLGTAGGDRPAGIVDFYNAALRRGLAASHLQLFLMPNVDDLRGHLLDQDVTWVFGGSVAGLLAMWQLHGVDEAMRAAWQAGVVLTGVSAGSICWHVGGTTDSFGPQLQPVTNGLALVPYSNGVHYDAEPQRRPLFQSLIADGTLPAGYATDDGVGVLYHGTDFVEAVSEKPDAGAYYVERDADAGAVETRLDTRHLSKS